MIELAKAKKTKKKKAVQAEVNIGLIGHVDAGKTSLVEAMSGEWVDTHSEELKRGISIRIGYADTSFYKCPNCKKHYSASEKCPDCEKRGKFLRKISFVDAPGHETLMTTMLGGASMMNGAVLVIAANEKCPQPQTIEHLNALNIVGIEKIVVAQNKIDLVEEKQAAENYKQIKEFLKKQGYENAPIIPVAAHSKANIDLLIEAIEKTIPTPKFDPKKEPRMYCGRSFDVNKPGTKPKDLKGGVLGGTLLQGKIKTGEKIEILPGFNGEKIVTRVENISCAEGKLKEAKSGGLLALETNLDPGLTQNDQMKGQVIGGLDSLPKPVKEISMNVSFLPRQVTKSTEKIKTNESLVLTVGTATVIGIAKEATDNTVKVVLKSPVVVEKGQKIAISRKEKMKWRLIAFGKTN